MGSRGAGGALLDAGGCGGGGVGGAFPWVGALFGAAADAGGWAGVGVAGAALPGAPVSQGAGLPTCWAARPTIHAHSSPPVSGKASFGNTPPLSRMAASLRACMNASFVVMPAPDEGAPAEEGAEDAGLLAGAAGG